MLAVLALGCEVHGLVGSNASAGLKGDPGDDPDAASTGNDPVDQGETSNDDASPGASGGGEGGGQPPVWFDVGASDGPAVCLAPLPTSCDSDSDDPWDALGITCGNVTHVSGQFNGHPDALAVHHGPLGTHGTFDPKEGERLTILSTGRAADLPLTHQQLACDPANCPSTELDPTPITTLPDPLDVRRVHQKLDCYDDPNLVGNGDCSNTLEDEWFAGGTAVDYAELRMEATVPAGADALIYRFAFFSAEYPVWVEAQSPWNDMYVAWLESEAWTGNISFDELGNPITINGVFLDYLDADSPVCSRTPCVAPELDGFAMDGHAGTQWLETVAPVVENEEIELVMAVFDLTDGLLDTAVILDGMHWGCTDLPPLTTPAG